jgi:hypothetical protein
MARKSRMLHVLPMLVNVRRDTVEPHCTNDSIDIDGAMRICSRRQLAPPPTEIDEPSRTVERRDMVEPNCMKEITDILEPHRV